MVGTLLKIGSLIVCRLNELTLILEKKKDRVGRSTAAPAWFYHLKETKFTWRIIVFSTFQVMIFLVSGGLAADLATYTLNGLHGFVAMTYLTALTEKWFWSFQLMKLFSNNSWIVSKSVDLEGIKIGLYKPWCCRKLWISSGTIRSSVVLRPVLVCKETHDVASASELCQELIHFFPYVSVITRIFLSRSRSQRIETLEDMKSAVQITWLGCASSDYQEIGNRLSQDKSCGCLLWWREFLPFLENQSFKRTNAGAGCTFASSIASQLVKEDYYQQ